MQESANSDSESVQVSKENTQSLEEDDENLPSASHTYKYR